MFGILCNVTAIHSPKGLLGTPVLMNAIIQSSNHMAVASMHLGVWSWSRLSPELQTESQNGKERFTKNGVKREKHPVCGSPVGENASLMLEFRGEWAD